MTRPSETYRWGMIIFVMIVCLTVPMATAYAQSLEDGQGKESAADPFEDDMLDNKDGYAL